MKRKISILVCIMFLFTNVMQACIFGQTRIASSNQQTLMQQSNLGDASKSNVSDSENAKEHDIQGVKLFSQALVNVKGQCDNFFATNKRNNFNSVLGKFVKDKTILNNRYLSPVLNNCNAGGLLKINDLVTDFQNQINEDYIGNQINKDSKLFEIKNKMLIYADILLSLNKLSSIDRNNLQKAVSEFLAADQILCSRNLYDIDYISKNSNSKIDRAKMKITEGIVKGFISNAQTNASNGNIVTASLLYCGSYSTGINSMGEIRTYMNTVNPGDLSVNIRPDSNITFKFDINQKGFSKIQNILQKKNVDITVNGKSAKCVYDSKQGTLTGSLLLNRYSNNVVMLSLSNNKINNDYFIVRFSTGSALHEATHISVKVDKDTVRVTENAPIEVNVTDDYGLPATNATVKVQSSSDNIESSDLVLGPDDNGQGVITLTDHVKEVPKLNVISKDNTYNDNVDTQTAQAKICFIAGLPNHITVYNKSEQVVDTTQTVAGVVYDVYNNPVENDTIITAEVSGGNIIPQTQNTNDGKWSFDFKAPVKVSDISIKIKASEAVAESVIRLIPDKPSQIVFNNSEYQFECDKDEQIVFIVTDSYGNAVPNAICKIYNQGNSDVSKTVTTDSHGTATFSISDATEENLNLTVETENGVKGTVNVVFSKPTKNPPDAPHVTLTKEHGDIMLRWQTVANAVYYTVKKQDNYGQYIVCDDYVTDNYFADGDISSGNTYKYIVTASNEAGTSKESNEVITGYTIPMDDLGVLKVSKNTVFTNNSTTLTFHINPKGRLANNQGIKLQLLDGTTVKDVVVMCDDGNVSNGDDIQNDGIYSGRIILNESSEKILKYRAFVNIEIDDNAKDLYSSNTLDVNCVTHITDEDMQTVQSVTYNVYNAYNETLTNLQSVIGQTYSNNGSALEQPQLRDVISNKILSVLQSDPDVIQSGYSQNDQSVWYVLKSGIKGVIPITVPGTNGSLNSTTLDFDYNYPDSNSSTFKDISTQLNNGGYNSKYIMGNNVNVEQFKTLNGNGAILIDCHGNLYNDTPYICSAEKVDNTNEKTYEEDLKTGRLIVVSAGPEKYYGIMPNFIAQYNTSLPNTIVFLGSCDGLKNDKMWNAFSSLGAKAMFGFDGEVYKDYSEVTAKIIFDGMVNQGLTTGEAYDSVVDNIGDNDNAWKGADTKPAAYIQMYGDETATLTNDGSLSNGDFENGLDGWTTSGDARILTQLGSLKPTSGNNMAIISTGLGSVNDSNSYIEQRIYIPQDSTKLSFDYNVVSEEPMEYVGSVYDDKFQCTAELNSDTQVLAQETVNTSKWLPVSGIDFYGGDSTTYMTDWKHCDFDVTKYRGQYLTLRFHVWDAGDSAYDTAALIDNITMDGSASSDLNDGDSNDDDKEYLTWPTDSTQITLHNGQIDEESADKHVGIDIQGAQGDEAYAAADGEVVFAGQKEGYGNVVIINSEWQGKNIQTRYAHLNSIKVETGDYVFAGDELGEIGNTGGNVTGDYVLNFRVLESTDGNECSVDGSNDVNVDPESYLFPYYEIEAVDDLGYLSDPFSYGILPDDSLETMGAAVTNRNLPVGYVYVNTMEKRYGKDNMIVKYIDSKHITITMPGHKTGNRAITFGIGYKNCTATYINKKWAIKISAFMKIFYPETCSTIKYQGYIDIKSYIGQFNPYLSKVQSRLNSLGYAGSNGNKLNTNGICNQETLNAINDFKRLNDLPFNNKNSGIVNAKTWNKLFSNKVNKYQRKGKIVGEVPKNYKKYIYELRKAHPAWTFQFYDANISLSDFVDEEWKQNNPTPKTAYAEFKETNQKIIAQRAKYGLNDSGQFLSNINGIEFFADPMHFLNDNKVGYGTSDGLDYDDYGIYQFFTWKMERSQVTLDDVKQLLTGTYFERDLTNYATYFFDASKQFGINPYLLVSNALVETGAYNKDSQNPLLTGGNTANVYNYFGIGAFDGVNAFSGEVKYALNNKWFTPKAAIYGGAKFVFDNYVKGGQDTYYLFRYNLYNINNQYCSDISGAWLKGYSLKEIKDSLSNLNITFRIPCFK